MLYVFYTCFMHMTHTPSTHMLLCKKICVCIVYVYVLLSEITPYLDTTSKHQAAP